MKLYQTKGLPVNKSLHEVRGNCLAACLASFTGMSVEQVPRFEDLPAGTWKQELPKWISSLGMSLAKRYTPRNNDEVCIGVGMIEGGRHAMIFRGNTPIHDPAKPVKHSGPILPMEMLYYLYIDGSDECN